MNITRRITTSIAVGLTMLLSLSACSQQEKPEGPDYADDEAMSIIATGFEKRSDKINELQQAGKDTYSTANLKAIVQTELDIDSELRSRPFENSEMQEQIIAYINTLNDSIKLLKNSSTSSDGFNKEWNEIRDERSMLLKTFVDTYDLTVDAQYKDDLDELTANGAAVTEQNEIDNTINQLVENAVFTKQGDGYGSFTYSATIQNTSSFYFENVGIILALYDAQNIKVEETYTDTSSWAPGENVLFKAFSTTDASTIKASVSYYDVKD